MTLRKAIVVATHPEDNSVDLVMCDDFARLTGVPVLAQNASTRTGGVNLPAMPDQKQGADIWDIRNRNGQDMEALVGFMGRGNPVVVGFLFPQISQMTFEDKKRSFSRHQSDVYYTIDGGGDIELYHPSGAYVRIGEKTEHEDLEKKNYDKNLQFDRNKNKDISIHVQTTAGRAYITMKAGGEITISAEKVINITAGEAINIKAPDIKIDGEVAITGSGVTHNGVNIGDTHVHTHVRTGPDNSGPPL